MDRELKDTKIYVAFDDLEPLDVARPEKRLLRAILISALSDLKKPGDPSRQAIQYFLNQSEEYIFSFRSVCNYLDIDPGKVLQVAGLSQRMPQNLEAMPAASTREQ